MQDAGGIKQPPKTQNHLKNKYIQIKPPHDFSDSTQFSPDTSPS